jgi:hypothetical protein
VAPADVNLLKGTEVKRVEDKLWTRRSAAQGVPVLALAATRPRHFLVAGNGSVTTSKAPFLGSHT